MPVLMRIKTKKLIISAMVLQNIIAVLFFTTAVSAQETNFEKNLKNHVEKLCATSKPRNFKNLDALNQAADYIIEVLDSAEYDSKKQEYFVEKNKYYNIICTYGDTTLPRLVIGAHYDVCDEQVGADDNASGVAGLLEIAKKLKKEKPQLSYCLEMVFYTLEEPPFFRTQQMGSYIHAKSLVDAKKEVLGMISLEMIGYYSEEKKSQRYPIRLLKLFYPSKGNFIAVVAKSGNKKLAKFFKKGIARHSEMKSEKLIAPAKLQGIDFSDHLNYWHFGFKAIMITDSAFLRNRNYHKKTDTPETLNFLYMSRTVEGIYGALLNFNA